MELGAGVFVAAGDAQPVLEVLLEAVIRRRELGRPVLRPVRELAGELARMARAERDRVSAIGTSERSDVGNGRTMGYMSTQQAAVRLGIGARAVVARLHGGALHGVKVNGRWLVDLDQEAVA